MKHSTARYHTIKLKLKTKDQLTTRSLFHSEVDVTDLKRRIYILKKSNRSVYRC